MTQRTKPAAGAPSVEGPHAPAVASYADMADLPVVITGGSSGIGAYLVYAFAAQGARTCFLSLEREAGDALCDAVERDFGRRPYFAECDLRNVADAQNHVATFARAAGPPAVLINNAGVDSRHELATLTPDDWDDLLRVNLRPVAFMTQALTPGMRERGGGSIINMGSNAALLGLPGYPAYVAAKAAIHGLTRALARELGADNIRVNTLVPGWVMTQRQQRLWANPADVAACLASQCLKTTLSGPDIAGAALFLASAASALMTAQMLIIDGGRA